MSPLTLTISRAGPPRCATTALPNRAKARTATVHLMRVSIAHRETDRGTRNHHGDTEGTERKRSCRLCALCVSRVKAPHCSVTIASIMTTAPPLVDISNLVFSYGGPEVLHSLSFRLNKGEIIGLLGPTGAGKSTTIKII